MRYKFFQYPRGVNKGGVLNTEICPTISTSSWENNCFLIEIEECDSTEVKTDDSLAVMEDSNKDKCIQVGNIYPDSENMANRSGGRVNSTTGCAPTILSRDFKQPKMIMEESILIPEATAKGYAEATDGDSVNLGQPSSKTRRGRVGKQMANTLTTSCNQGVVVSEPKIIEVGFVKEGKHQQDYVQHEDGICRTICQGTHGSGPHLLKTMVSAQLRQDGLGATGVVQIGNIYPDTDDFKNKTSGRVNSAEGLSPCLNCCEGGGLEPKIIITDNGNNETKGIYTESNETNTRKILQILREEVGEETYQWTIGRLVSIFKAEILQQGVYEEGICKDGETLSRIQPCASYLAENCLFDTREGNEVRDMRCDTEYRCASQGFQLSEQFAREFNDIMSQLPHETASTKECMSYMWQTCKGTQLMQQTLHTLEEIWRPTTQTLEYIQSPKYRIRKLTCREVFRLMDVDDADIDKIQAAGISNSQQYKLAGNSIVVACLEKIFEQMFFPQYTNSRTLFG